MRRTLFVSIIFLVPLFAQDTLETKNKLLAISNGILKDATFQLVDQKTGTRYKSTEKIPDAAQLKPESPYNDWRYWNGVLNIAMIRLSEVLNERSYAEFARKNIAFSFDCNKYFQSRYDNEGKWNYPFGQFFVMEELDDCGAMGASVIEVYRTDKQERYHNYIDQTANHILNKTPLGFRKS